MPKSDKYIPLEVERKRRERLVRHVKGRMEQASFQEENNYVKARCHFIGWSLTKKGIEKTNFKSFIVYLSEALPPSKINWVIQNAFRKVKKENQIS